MRFEPGREIFGEKFKVLLFDVFILNVLKNICRDSGILLWFFMNQLSFGQTGRAFNDKIRVNHLNSGGYLIYGS